MSQKLNLVWGDPLQFNSITPGFKWIARLKIDHRSISSAPSNSDSYHVGSHGWIFQVRTAKGVLAPTCFLHFLLKLPTRARISTVVICAKRIRNFEISTFRTSRKTYCFRYLKKESKYKKHGLLDILQLGRSGEISIENYSMLRAKCLFIESWKWPMHK